MVRTQQLSDATGVLMSTEVNNQLYAIGNTVPADGSSGFAPGCVFIHSDGTHGAGSTDLLYINVGTAASDGITDDEIDRRIEAEAEAVHQKELGKLAALRAELDSLKQEGEKQE